MEQYLTDKPLKEILLVLSVIEIVRKRQRNVPDGRGVLPKTVQSWMPEYRNESTLRRDMSKLWRAGLLERCGGTASSRQGYFVARDSAPKLLPATTPRNKQSRLQWWRNTVLEADKYTCQCCKQRGGRLVVHEVRPVKLHPELRFDVSNGMTLCEACDRKFKALEKREQQGAAVA